MASHPSGHPRWLIAAPIAAALVWIVAINSISIVWHLTRPWPIDPWEAAVTMEGWRASQGLPVYEDKVTGHATHMYGALSSVTLGRVFRLTGANNYAGRIFSLASGLVLVGVLAWTVSRGQPQWYAVMAAVLFFGTNYRCKNYFAWNRADLAAWLLGGVALLLFYRGFVRGRRWEYLAGVAVLVVAFFYKQPAAMVAAIPGVAMVFASSTPRRERLLLALTPLVAMVGTVAIMERFFPTVFFYMVENPGYYALSVNQLAKGVWVLFMDTPLFLLLLADGLLTGQGWPRRARDPGTWVLAALVVTVPACGLAMAKLGGGTNSLLPALLALMAFCVLRLGYFLPRLFDGRLPLVRSLASSALVAVLMVMSAFPIFVLNLRYLTRPDHRAAAYQGIVEEVRSLPGEVVCPEDPTVTLYARGTVNRSLYLEYESVPVDGGWAPAAPSYATAEIAAADWVVDVHEFTLDPLTDDDLEELGFEPVDRGRYYTLWRKSPPSVHQAKRVQ